MPPSDPAETNSFLDSLNFPVINSDVAKELDSPLTLVEITCAMKSMLNNKAPGPDGYRVEFFLKISA